MVVVEKIRKILIDHNVKKKDFHTEVGARWVSAIKPQESIAIRMELLMRTNKILNIDIWDIMKLLLAEGDAVK